METLNKLYGVSPYWAKKHLNAFEFENDDEYEAFFKVLEMSDDLYVLSDKTLIKALKVFYFNDVVSIQNNHSEILSYHDIINCLCFANDDINNIINDAVEYDGGFYVEQLVLLF